MNLRPGVLIIYFGIILIIFFLIIASLAPKIGNNFGFLSDRKEFQKGYALVDSDNDGFDDETEVAIGTLPSISCSPDGLQDAWPPDFNKDNKVDNQDINLYKQNAGKFKLFNKRYDLSGNSQINKKDEQILQSYIGKTCTSIIPVASPSPVPFPTLSPSPSPIVSKSSPSPLPSPVGGSSPEYGVRPVIFLPADTSIDIDSYKTQANASFQKVRDWYAGQLGGKTFDLIDAIVYKSPMTTQQLYSKYSGNMAGIWFEGMKEAVQVNGLTVCDPKRFYYFVTPLENVWGGMVGAESFGCTTHVLPGSASIPSHMGRLVGGIIDPDWPEWWADEIREAQGGVAHELGHGFGGECSVGNYVGGGCNGLAHSEDPSIMFSWWDFDKTAVFFNDEKTKVLKSPFIH